MYKIEKNIPYDESKFKTNRGMTLEVKETILSLKPKESFLIPVDTKKLTDKETKRILQNKRTFIRQCIKEFKLSTEVFKAEIVQGGIRVWKVK